MGKKEIGLALVLKLLGSSGPSYMLMKPTKGNTKKW
jgi:hypothetical protein